jgi:hypothetical protein
MTSNLSWMDIALKLHLPEMIQNQNDENTKNNKTVMEHMTEALLRDASLRIRREPEIVLSGLAERPRTTPLPPLNTFEDETPGGATTERYEKLSLLEEREHQTNTKLRLKAAAMANNLTSTHVATEQTKRYRPLINHSKLNSKPSVENWIPEPIRFRSLHRDLMTMQENIRSTISFEKDNSREIRRFQTTDLQKNLLEEELRLKKKLKCGCCLQIFSQCNLPMKVPLKAILDIRKKWISDKPTGGGEGDNWWKKDDERLAAVPRCYEAALICTFCSQFFDLQEEYRPSFDKIQREIKRKQFLEAKRLEKQYWDPLKTGELEMERLYQAELQKTAAAGGGGSGGGMSRNSAGSREEDESGVEYLSTDGGGVIGIPGNMTNGLITIQYE